jgi:hypothetical protein
VTGLYSEDSMPQVEERQPEVLAGRQIAVLEAHAALVRRRADLEAPVGPRRERGEHQLPIGGGQRLVEP